MEPVRSIMGVEMLDAASVLGGLDPYARNLANAFSSPAEVATAWREQKLMHSMTAVLGQVQNLYFSQWHNALDVTALFGTACEPPPVHCALGAVFRRF